MEKSNAEKSNRKARSGFLFTAVAAVLSAVAILMACTVFFRVENIEVTGSERYTQEEVADGSEVLRGSSLILTRKDLLSRHLCENLPYVGSVEVKKRFPTTLRLNVTDTIAAAKVTSGDAWWVMDPTGKVLEQVQEGQEYPGFPVTGLDIMAPEPGQQAQVLDENAGQLSGLVSLMTALQEQGILGQITQIYAGSKTEITLLYQDRLKVKFLLGVDYERKVRIFREIAAMLGDYEIGTVDLKTERACFTPSM